MKQKMDFRLWLSQFCYEGHSGAIFLTAWSTGMKDLLTYSKLSNSTALVHAPDLRKDKWAEIRVKLCSGKLT